MPETIPQHHPERTSAGDETSFLRVYQRLNDSRFGWLLLLLLAVLPTMFYWRIGYGGGDYLFRVNVWLALHNALRAGQWELGWMNASRFGFGAPALCFYPPVEAVLTTALSFLLPLRWAPGAIVWLALVATGTCMYVAAPGFNLRKHRLTAAVLLLFSGNTLFLLLTRYNPAEALVAAALPLILLCFYRALRYSDVRIAGVTALLLAFAWLCDVPESIVLFYTLGTAACVLAVLRRRIAPVLLYCLMQGGALAVALFRLGPTLVEKKWVHSNALLLYHFKELMLGWPIPPRHPWIWYVDFYTLVLCGVGALLIWRLRRRGTSMPPGMSGLLIGMAVAAVCIWLPPTAFLWAHLPEFVFIQFPYRFLPFLNLAIPLFLLQAAVPRRFKLAGAAVYLALAILPIVIFVHQAPELGVPSFNAAVHQWQTRGFEGPPEYVPADVPMDPVQQFLVAHLDVGLAGRTTGCNATTLSKTQNVYVFGVHTTTPCHLVIGIFWYPYWTASLDNGQPWRVTATADGAMQVDLPSGPHTLTLRFMSRSTLRAVTAWLSFAALLGLLAICLRRGPQRKTIQDVRDGAPLPDRVDYVSHVDRTGRAHPTL